MAHPWKPVRDFPSNAVPVHTPAPEAFVVGDDGVALLEEAPHDPTDVSTPMVVTVGGLSRERVTGTPSAGQYRVKRGLTPNGWEWLPELEFHASDIGASGTADYYAFGTIVTARRWVSFMGHLMPLSGYADQAALEAAVAPSSSLDAIGWAGRFARTADGNWYYSTGTQWVPFGGGSPAWSGSLTDGAVAGSTQDAAWVEAAGSLTAGAVAGESSDAIQGGAGTLSDGAAAGATQDATYSSNPFDDFNRADGAIGSNWTAPSGKTAPSISGNKAVGSDSAERDAYWTNWTGGANQRAWIKVANVGASDISANVRVRSGSNGLGYTADWHATSASGGVLTCFRMDGAQIGTDVPLTQANVAYLDISANGTTITVRTSTNGTDWTSRISATDSTYASGSPGIRFYNHPNAAGDTSVGIDEFGANPL